MSLPAFLAPTFPARPTFRRPRNTPSTRPRFRMSTVPLQERVLRLERALAAAVQQERYTDAATLRDALEAARTADPVLNKRSQLTLAVENEDFALAAQLRDEIAALTERFSRTPSRRVDRIIVLRGKGDAETALRVATVSREGSVQLALTPPYEKRASSPRVYLQPTWSPSGDFVAMTEITFDLESPRPIGRGIAIADSTSRVIVMNAFDGSVVKAESVPKPPFFYLWSPDGRCVSLLASDAGAPVATVALSNMQVVAPRGGGDVAGVKGPLASGHPFLYDFCARDSGRCVAHMGDSSSVAVVPLGGGAYKYLTKKAGNFGAPQWHPLAGKDGREVVFFVEQDGERKQNDKLKGKEELPQVETVAVENKSQDKVGGVSIESLLNTGGTLLENVLRKGAESLGLTKGKGEREGGDKNEDENETIAGRFKKLLPISEDDEPPKELKWGGEVQDESSNRLVMCDVEDPTRRRVLARFTGVMAFKLSPDGTALATLVTNPLTGEDELTICTGDFSPDSVAGELDGRGMAPPTGGEADIILSTPQTRVLAFFWSPDARKLLFLTSLRKSSVGAAQWATFDRDSNRIVRYEKFVVSGIYMHCLNFFDQFGASMTPWSPDSDAFCYPGRPLTEDEIETDEQSSGESPSLSALFLQRDQNDGKRFSARVQRIPLTTEAEVQVEVAFTIVDNVEYACWSPC